jgi:hypothetical protein
MFVVALQVAISTSYCAIAETIFAFILRLQDLRLDQAMVRCTTSLIQECVRCNSPRVVESVMSFGFDGEVTESLAKSLFTRGDGSVLRHMIQQGHIDVNETMGYPNPVRPLHMAFFNKRSDVFKTLLDCGANIDGTTYTIGRGGVSLLWHATNRADVHLVKFLLAHGANPRSHEGWRAPLKIAQERGCAEIIDLLEGAQPAMSR